MSQIDSYISVDTFGVKRIAGTRISLDSVVIGFQEGQSPEEIQRNYPLLSLEQVYGGITYYLANRADVEAYLKQQRANFERIRAEHEKHPNPAMERIRKMRAAQTENIR